MQLHTCHRTFLYDIKNLGNTSEALFVYAITYTVKFGKSLIRVCNSIHDPILVRFFSCIAWIDFSNTFCVYVIGHTNIFSKALSMQMRTLIGNALILNCIFANVRAHGFTYDYSEFYLIILSFCSNLWHIRYFKYYLETILFLKLQNQCLSF